MKPADPIWYLAKDGDPELLALYERHYSCYQYKDGRTRKLFVGPGEKVVLCLQDKSALFVWRKFLDDAINIQTNSPTTGINCAVFRNESTYQASDLVAQACRIAFALWPNSRLYTYVDPRRIRSRNPGFCFKQAGWRKCGATQGGLIILETYDRTS